MSQVSAAERRSIGRACSSDKQPAQAQQRLLSEENIAVPSFYLGRMKLQNDKATNVTLPVKFVTSADEITRPPQQIRFFTPSGFSLRFNVSISTDTSQCLLASIESSAARSESC